MNMALLVRGTSVLADQAEAVQPGSAGMGTMARQDTSCLRTERAGVKSQSNPWKSANQTTGS